MTSRSLAVFAVCLLTVHSVPLWAGDTYGPTRRGDTLWGIAGEVYRGETVTRDQAILALLRANPDAFGSPCNASSPLQIGAMLEVPPPAEATALSADAARREFQRQLQEWTEHRRSGEPVVCPPAATPSQPAVRAPAMPQPTEGPTPAQPATEASARAAPSEAGRTPTQPTTEAAKPAPPNVSARTAPGPTTAAPTSAARTQAAPRPPQPTTAATTTTAQSEVAPSPAPMPRPAKPSAPGEQTGTQPSETSQPAAAETEPQPSGTSQPAAEQPPGATTSSPVGELRHLWREIEPELAKHERLDWLGILAVIGLIVGVLLHEYRKGRRERQAASKENAAPTAGDFDELSVEEVVQRLDTDLDQGLGTSEAEDRLEQYGRNALEEQHRTLLERLLPFFWGPIPWMIEVAAILSALVRHWADLAIILALLLFNAGIGFWQEHKAANALDALKRQLALKARVRRDGRWQQTAADRLVPGDVIRLRLGDVIPADAKLVRGDYLSVDQSALTGESLPVDKQAGEIVYSGSAAKQGEAVAVVAATGENTYFGRTAKLVEGAGGVSHFQKAVLAIGDYLIYLSLALVSILIIAQLLHHARLLDLVQFALILTVASIPVAMPAVLSVTLAVGALLLSRMKAIVSRLQSIEEMAGIDILCSDKTGTLTQNRLTLGEPEVFSAADAQDLILAGALASDADGDDPIDRAVIGGLDDEDIPARYRQEKLVPFDPVGKRTEAQIEGPDGERFKVSKGAPQVIFELSELADADAGRADERVQELAAKGFRTLGVARTDADGKWRFLGILPLFDPPREDSEETIRQAEAHGIAVKMVTGDNTAIAREIAGRLGLGTAIQKARQLLEGADKEDKVSADVAERIEQADGFAEVFPEHKYAIVKALQERDHLVAMTGDGVNDAPALKQADVGIAVSGATDAARAAADLVLTAPGLSTIVSAVEEARRIFERMNSYAIYRVIETIRIMFFMVAAMLVYHFYPITAIMIILLALLNDIPIMAIAYDNTWLDPKPVRWQMHRVLTVATVLGLIGVVETFLLLAIAYTWVNIDLAQVQTIIFLKLSVAGHLTLFVARTKRPMWTRPFPAPALLGAILGTQVVAALIAGFGILIEPIPWSYIALIWAYCLVWVLIEDLAKLALYRRLNRESPQPGGFLQAIRDHVPAHASP
jgi:H+-transporting ATPase